MALLTFEWSKNTLAPALENLSKEAEAAVAQVVEDTTNRAFKIAKNKTPTDRGDARRGWRKESRGSQGRIFNDVAYINVLEFGGFPVTALGRSGTLRPGALIRGRAQLGGAPPPKKRDKSGKFTGTARTQSARGSRKVPMTNNVSKQAPRGMVRAALAEIQPRFLSDLKNAINSLPSWNV